MFRTFTALAVVLVGVAAAHAQAAKPMAVVSIASYETQMSNVDFFGKMAGKPNASQQIDGFLKIMTQGQGLNGLDKSKPWGVAVMAGAGAPELMAFVPVSNARDLIDSLAIFVGSAQDEGDGVLKLSPRNAGGQAFFVREKDGWAYITNNRDAGELPGDPMELIGALSKEYDVAIRGYMQNIPEPMKQGWINQARQLSEMAVAMQAQDGPVSAELQRASAARPIDLAELVLTDGNELTVGWKVDQAAKDAFFDITVTAVDGSDLASRIASLSDAKTNFAGLLKPEYAVNFLLAVTLGDAQIKSQLEMLATYRKAAHEAIEKDDKLDSDEARNSVKAVLNQLFDVADETIKVGKPDAGVAVNLEPEKLQVVGATFVADGAKLEAAVKDLVELARGDEGFEQKAQVKFDVETHQGVKLHHALINVDEEDARKAFGDKLDVYVGIGPKAAYLAMGKDSLSLIKSIIDSSSSEPGKQVLPMQLSVSLVQILEFAASVEPRSPAAMFAAMLAESKGNDHVLVTLSPVSNGLNFRVKVEEGVLQAMSAMSNAPGAGGPGGDF